MNIEDCEGCLTRINSDECIWFNKSLDCPCAFCLIKVMCSNRCESLNKHTAKIYKTMGITTLSGQIDYVAGNKNG